MAESSLAALMQISPVPVNGDAIILPTSLPRATLIRDTTDLHI